MMEDVQELSASKIRYLVTLSQLDPERKGVRSISLARRLNISRPSVHAMIEKLEDMGYVTKEYYGIIYLTDKGMAVGREYSSRNN